MDSIRPFRELHSGGSFVMPNPWDIGSAVVLEQLGFVALATTSSGLALANGQLDGAIGLEQLAEHVRQIHGAISVPINVDAERLFSEDLGGLAASVETLVDAGAAGVSIEDYSRERDGIDEVEIAARRVGAAVEAASASGVVVTARAENLIRGVNDIADTLERLRAYRDAGADVLYAPGLVDPDDIAAAVAIGPPLNVLARPTTPPIAELASLGVRRVSIGGSFALAAYAALVDAANEVLEHGTSTYQLASPNFGTATRLLADR